MNLLKLKCSETHSCSNFELDIDTQVPLHGITGVWGQSGSGKTTLLRLIAGLDSYKNANVELQSEGTDLEIWQESNSNTPTHLRDIAFVFQEAVFLDHLTVNANILYGYNNLPKHKRTIDPSEVIKLVGAQHLLDRRVERLSGGERQRVAIARALLKNPKVLLMDEPLSALDESAKKRILEVLETIYKKWNIPILYVSHSLSEITRLCDYLLVVEKGRILDQGKTNEVLTRPDSVFSKLDHTCSVIQVCSKFVNHENELYCGDTQVYLNESIKASKESFRMTIYAKDVSIALEKPKLSSILNIWKTKILQINIEDKGSVWILLEFEGQKLISRISQKSQELLDLKPGQEVFAQIKSMSLSSQV